MMVYSPSLAKEYILCECWLTPSQIPPHTVPTLSHLGGDISQLFLIVAKLLLEVGLGLLHVFHLTAQITPLSLGRMVLTLQPDRYSSRETQCIHA